MESKYTTSVFIDFAEAFGTFKVTCHRKQYIVQNKKEPHCKISHLDVHKELFCNHFHNILRLFSVLPNFPFTTSETIRNYYL